MDLVTTSVLLNTDDYTDLLVQTYVRGWPTSLQFDYKTRFYSFLMKAILSALKMRIFRPPKHYDVNVLAATFIPSWPCNDRAIIISNLLL